MKNKKSDDKTKTTKPLVNESKAENKASKIELKSENVNAFVLSVMEVNTATVNL